MGSRDGPELGGGSGAVLADRGDALPRYQVAVWIAVSTTRRMNPRRSSPKPPRRAASVQAMTPGQDSALGSRLVGPRSPIPATPFRRHESRPPSPVRATDSREAGEGPGEGGRLLANGAAEIRELPFLPAQVRAPCSSSTSRRPAKSRSRAMARDLLPVTRHLAGRKVGAEVALSLY